jgi:hypothetical protein
MGPLNLLDPAMFKWALDADRGFGQYVVDQRPVGDPPPA